MDPERKYRVIECDNFARDYIYTPEKFVSEGLLTKIEAEKLADEMNAPGKRAFDRWHQVVEDGYELYVYDPNR